VKIKPGIREYLWMAVGAGVFLAGMLVVSHFKTDQTPAGQIALKAKRVEMVAKMRLDLASSSEAEKSAVMAVTDKDSLAFAGQARAAAAEVERGRNELVSAGGTQGEKDLLAQFSKEFAEFKRIDNELLSLAVKNTNIKAYNLAFGPAADAVKEMDNALSRIVEKSAVSPDAAKMALLAFGAQTSVLRIQALLAPHIAEESDKKMDQMEAQMSNEDRQAKKDLDTLSALPKLHSDPDLKTATAAYARFSDIRVRILALSRENTNVRSLAISLTQKRKVFFVCQDTLSALQQAIQTEPVPGAASGEVSNPRSLETDKPVVYK